MDTKQKIQIGKFTNNIYTPVELVEPYPQNKGTEPYPHFPGTDNPCPENVGTNNISPTINNLKINNFFGKNQQSASTSDGPAVQQAKPAKTNDKTRTPDNEPSERKNINIENKIGVETKIEQKKSLNKPFRHPQQTIYKALFPSNILFTIILR